MYTVRSLIAALQTLPDAAQDKRIILMESADGVNASPLASMNICDFQPVGMGANEGVLLEADRDIDDDEPGVMYDVIVLVPKV